MSNLCCITGHTHGLGKYLYEYFINKGWVVVGLSRSNGYDIEKDVGKIAELAKGCQLFINNAYANGLQNELLDLTFGHVEKIIVCGSVASDHPDPNLVEYSKHKKLLEKRCNELADVKSSSDLLLLKLTSSSYKNFRMISKTIDLWLENPSIVQIKFNVADNI
jgi:hypothetical protein